MKLAKEIESLSGLSYKVCILGHIQRGGAPTVKDRKIASLMGYEAVQCLIKGYSQKMIALENEKIVAKDFPDPALGARLFEEENLLKINRILCEL